MPDIPPPQGPPPAPPLGPLYGPVFFGTILSTLFYGVACMQTFFYHIHYQNDPSRIKIFVIILWALTTVNEALCVSGAYKYITAGLLDNDSFTTWSPDLVILNLVSALVAIPTQGFLVRRIYVFGGKKIILPFIFVVLALVQLVCSIVYVVKALPSREHVFEICPHDNNSFVNLGTLMFSSAAGVDVLIAIFTTFLLARHRITTEFVSTANILQRLIVFAVNSGTWTATFALLGIILLHLFPSTLIYSVFLIPHCSVYYNTLLVNLNVRAYVQGDETTYDVDLDLATSPDMELARTNGDIEHGEISPVFSVHQNQEDGVPGRSLVH